MWNSIKPYLRSLQKRKTISMITIGGYAISMAVLLILVLFIIGEKNVNKGFEKADQMYRIKREENQQNLYRKFLDDIRAVKTGNYGNNAPESQATVPQTLLQDIKDKVPGIEKICLYVIHRSLMYEYDGRSATSDFMITNDDFLDMFSFDFLYRIENPTLSVKDHIILTQSFSEKLFSVQNPIGEVLKINEKTYNIVGVVNDPPRNSSFRFDALLSIGEAPFVSTYNFNQEEHHMFKSFVLLHKKANAEEVNHQISGMIAYWEAFKNDMLFLQPFKEVYFDYQTDDDLDHANVSMIYLLSCIALIILFMTIFNYANLTVSQSYERLNEIGIKKATGATRKDIFKQFITESMVAGFIAMILAVLLTTVIYPFFSEILGKETNIIPLLIQPRYLVAGILIFFSVGIFAGIYPALIISGVTPVRILTHNKGLKRAHNRAAIIAFQFVVTIILITSVLFINKQLEFVKKKDLGFDRELMVRIDLNRSTSQKWQVIKDKLMTNPSILNVTASFGTPFAIYSYFSGKTEGSGNVEITDMKVLSVDDDFTQTFDLSILKGRDFQALDSNVCFINEHLYNYLGWDDFNGRTLFGYKVVGIVKDFHYQNLYYDMGYLQLRKLTSQPTALSVKIRGEIAGNLEFIKNVFHEMDPGAPMDYRFYDEWIQSMYQKEASQLYAVKVYTVIAIIIACLGLIGMAELVTNKKTKEIGIRKVNGAKVYEVMAMLNKDFVKWVGIAFLIATPIAYYAMNKWLQNFAYKTSLSWWVFALAGMLALGIALLTVSWQSWRAASRNPVEALRYE